MFVTELQAGLATAGTLTIGKASGGTATVPKDQPALGFTVSSIETTPTTATTASTTTTTTTASTQEINDFYGEMGLDLEGPCHVMENLVTSQGQEKLKTSLDFWLKTHVAGSVTLP
jgi:hypothetical protein